MKSPKLPLNDGERTTRDKRFEQHDFRLPLAPVRVLVACGWVCHTDAGDSRLRVEVLTRSHQLARVTAPDGRAAIVKQPIHGQAYSRGLARELYVYRLAKWVSALEEVLPSALCLDEQRGLLAVESLAVGRNWPDETDLIPITSAGVALQLGRAMAQWHRETKAIPMAPSLAAGILHLPASLDTALNGRSASAQAFMQMIASDHELAEALHEGASIYRNACLIHGDIRPDNWLVCRRTTQSTLKVIDWEMSGRGDPAWDVGSACAECILQVIRSGVVLSRDDGGWPGVVQTTLREFLESYVNTGGALTDAREEWDRVVLYAGSRLLHVACEWAEYQANIDDGLVNEIAGQARRLLRTRRTAATSLASWANL
jgi:Phosphotransferase enzyme family